MPLSAPATESSASFRNGTLCLTRGSVDMRISGSPVPRAAMRRGREGSWVEFHPDFRLVHPYRPPRRAAADAPSEKQLVFDFFEQTVSAPDNRPVPQAQVRKRAFDHFRFSLPKRIAKILEPFPTHQWPLLVMLQLDPGAADLAGNNPALAYALAQRLRADRELIASLHCSSMRQRDLLGLLDLPSSPAAVNLFRKVDPRSLNGDNWEDLVSVIRGELGQPKSSLHHLASINAGVVEILRDPRARAAATVQLLDEVARDRAESHRGRVVHMITSTLRMQDELRTQERCERFQSLARLAAVHDRVAENYRRRVSQLIHASADGPPCFQPPPIPGIPGRIEPITNASELVDEGEIQGNCVASYADRVHAGGLYIYRVLHPERATLSIVRRGVAAQTHWEIGELERRFNTDVSEETEEFVQSWLDRHRTFV